MSNDEQPTSTGRPDPDPVGSAGRKNRQARRLPPDAACAICGEMEIAVLRHGPQPPHMLEGHHGAGRANDQDLLVTLCLNHHAQATALQLDVGATPPGKRASCLEAMELAFRSLGTFFELLAAAFYRWAAQLGQVIASLDEHLPSWRTLPGMP